VSAVNGVATFTNLIVGIGGTYTFSANDGSLTGATSGSVTFNAAGVGQVVFWRVPPSGLAGQALSPSLTVAVEDNFGNIITSNNSTVSLSIASGPGGFDSASTTSVAAVNGIATFTNLILDTTGGYTIQANDGTLGSATYSIQINSVPSQEGKQLAFEQVPASGTAGQPLSPAIVVAVEDQYGNVVTGDDSTVTLGPRSGPGVFTTGGTVGVAAINGMATFTNLVLDTAGTYSFVPYDGLMMAGPTQNVTISPAQATQLVFQEVPTTGIAGQTLSPSLTVAVEDQFGNIVTSDDSTVTLTVNLGPGSFTGGSTLSAAVVNGVATFSNLVLDTAGNYLLSASDGPLTSATSGLLTVTPAAATHLVFTQVPATGITGQSLEPAVTVEVEDQFDNVFPLTTTVVSLAVASGPGAFDSNSVTSVFTGGDGVATFRSLIFDLAGTYTLSASDGSLTGALSGNITVTSLWAEPSQSFFETNLSFSNPIGPNTASTIFVEYTNLGSVAMAAPLLSLNATQNGQSGALLSLTPSGASSQSVQFSATGATLGTLQPDESVTVPVYYTGWLAGQWDTSKPTITFTLTAQNASNPTSVDVANPGDGPTYLTTNETNYSLSGTLLSKTEQQIGDNSNGSLESTFDTETTYNPNGSVALTISVSDSYYADGSLQNTEQTVTNPDKSASTTSLFYADGDGSLGPETTEGAYEYIPGGTVGVSVYVQLAANGSGNVQVETDNGIGQISGGLTTYYGPGGVITSSSWEEEIFILANGGLTSQSPEFIDTSANGIDSEVQGALYSTSTSLSVVKSDSTAFTTSGAVESTSRTIILPNGSTEDQQASYYPEGYALLESDALYPATPNGTPSWSSNVYYYADGSGGSSLQTYNASGEETFYGAASYSAGGALSGRTFETFAYYPYSGSGDFLTASADNLDEYGDEYSSISHGTYAPTGYETSDASAFYTSSGALYQVGDSFNYASNGVALTTQSAMYSYADGYTVDANQSFFQTNVTTSSSLGQAGPSTIDVQYTNTGKAAMAAPLLMLTATQNGQAGAELTLDLSGAGASQSVEFLASGSTPGVLEPGETVTIPVYYEGWLPGQWQTSVSVTLSLQAIETSNTSTINWSTIEAGAKPPTISSTAWVPIFNNLQTSIGPTWGDYVSMLDANAQYLGNLGENLTDPAELWSFELQQAIGLGPIQDIGTTVDDQVAVPGLTLEFSRTFMSSLVGRSQPGPMGLGWSDNWQVSLAVQSDGTVVVSEPGGTQVSFTPNGGGGYADQPGDYETLTSLRGGAFSLEETNGTVTVFNSNGTLDYVQDTNGNRITAGYTSGLLTSLTDSSGQSLSIGHNSAGLISTVIDSSGRVTTYTYDPTDQYLMAVTGFNGQTTSYTYDTSGEASQNALTSIAFPGGTHQYFTYDDGGRLTSTYSDGGIQPLFFTYSFGEVSETDGAGDTTSLYYNEQGLLVKTVDPLGNATLDSYDNNFNVTTVTNAAGESETYAYNAAGELTSSTDFLGNTTTFSYSGPFNTLSAMNDANGNTTSYSYNSAGNLLMTTYANGTSETFTYTPEGEAASFVNANGQPISYGYNAAGQLTSETFSDGSEYTYTYNGLGNLVTATDATGTTTFTYDPVSDLLAGVSYPNGTSLSFTYNAAGQRTSMVDQTGFTVNYVYDVAGRLTGLTDANGNPIVTYTYDPAGRLAEKLNGNGTYTTYTYDADGNILDLVNYAPGGTVNSQFAYTYNAVGLETSEATLDGTWTYTYNTDGELTQAVFASTDSSIPNQDLVYNYDAVGNRTSTVINDVTTVYTTNNVNEYTSVGGTPYVYDADGNLLFDGTNTYTYNALNELTSVSGPSGTTTYTYNALGQQVSSTTNGQTTEYLNDPAGIGNVVGTYTGSGSLIADYTYGLGLTSQVTASTSYYYDFDALGSTAGLSNSAGSYVNGYSYLPFGGTLASSQTITNAFQFVGQLGAMTDASDLVDMRARSYAPATGTFTSIDPLGIEQPTLYGYVLNNPVQLIDSTGLGAVGEKFGDGEYANQLGVALANWLGVNIVTYQEPFQNNPYGFFHPVSPHVPPSGSGELGLSETSSDTSGSPQGGDYGLWVTSTVDPGYGLWVTSTAAQTSQAAENPGTPIPVGEDGIPLAEQSEDVDNLSSTGTQMSNDVFESGGYGPGAGTEYDYNYNASGELVTTVTVNIGDDGMLESTTTVTDAYNTDGSRASTLTTTLDNSNLTSTETQTDYNADGTSETTTTSYNADGVATSSTFTDADGNTTSWTFNSSGSVDGSSGDDSGGSDGGSSSGDDGGSDGGGGDDGGSDDPNWMVGPVGIGAQNFVSGNAVLPYQLDFENAATATAAAKTVTITDQLSSNLDGSTFELTGIGWGNTVLTIPSGSQHFETTVSMSENGQTFDVRVDAGIDSQTGLVSATFQSIDPSTGLPLSGLTGFLPPDNATGQGAGYLSFTVQPEAGLASGTQIRNVALVTFDQNQPVATDQVNDEDPAQGIDPSKQALVTIDSGAPSSSVAPLPAVEASTSFTVNWSGQDNAGGSGIHSYDVYVSDDNEPFILFQQYTTATSAIFSGTAGHTYSFYSIATDNVGNVQAIPATSQATTQIQSPPTTVITVVPATVETDPFDASQTALFVGGTPGNDTVSFALAGNSGIAVAVNGVSQGVYHPSGPLIVFGQEGQDLVQEDPALTNPFYLAESPNADNIESSLDNEALQWAGLSAAMEILDA
jgi:RHS repeat-associated protein